MGMSKGTLVALVVGVLLAVLGVILTVVWFWDFWALFKGALGPMLVLGGILMALIAWSEYQAAREMERITAQTQQPTTQPTGAAKPEEEKKEEAKQGSSEGS